MGFDSQYRYAKIKSHSITQNRFFNDRLGQSEAILIECTRAVIKFGGSCKK